MLLATLTRMWVKVGTQRLTTRWSTPGEIRTDDNHEKCYGYTAIDYVSCPDGIGIQSNKTHYRMAKDLFGREFLLFIKQLQRQYSNETVVIVMDNAPAHGYRKIHIQVKVNERLYFYFLPPYTAAKLNPVEKVFRFFRSKVTHNEYFADIADLIEAARNFFRYLYVCRGRVASLIHGEV